MQLTTVADSERLETAIVILTNQVLAAERVPFADRDRIDEHTQAALATLALGLELSPMPT